MANEEEWFVELLRRNLIDYDMRIAWANDLLAMGPHGAWVEPEPWANAMRGDADRRELVYHAGETVARHFHAYRTVLGASYLLGSDDAGEFAEKTSSNRLNQTLEFVRANLAVLEPLWARSSSRIHMIFSKGLINGTPAFELLLEMDPVGLQKSLLSLDLRRTILTNNNYRTLRSATPTRSRALRDSVTSFMTAMFVDDRPAWTSFTNEVPLMLADAFEQQVLRRR